MTSVYIIAGEASGDLLGGKLMRVLKARTLDSVKFAGVGGEHMRAEGLHSLFPYEELSLLGIAEILPHMLKIRARIDSVVEDIIAKQPDVVLTIDSPGFNVRVVRKLRQRGFAKGGRTKFIHYVAPTVWSHRPERAKATAELFDHLFVLLPFEPDYFTKEGLPTTFVGHPITEDANVRGDGAAFREKYQLAPDAPVFCLMPGSRRGEIKRHMPIFAHTMMLLAEQMPNLVLALPTRQSLMPTIAPYFEGCPLRAVVVAGDEDKRNAIAASTIALSKSGTVALELAQAGVPSIVTYRVHPVSAWVFSRMFTIKYVNLINILRDEEVIPELLQEHCTPALLANALYALMRDEDRRKRQQDVSAQMLAKLKLPDGQVPSEKVAEMVLQLAGSSYA